MKEVFFKDKGDLYINKVKYSLHSLDTESNKLMIYYSLGNI